MKYISVYNNTILFFAIKILGFYFLLKDFSTVFGD